MAWYRTGTVSVTNGSAAVAGTGTDFVANTQVGWAFQAPDGRSYEVASIQSSTQLTLAGNYLGATAAGQAYAVQPTSSLAADLALAVGTLINTFGAVRDGIGQGLIPAGTVAAPGIRFSADQDTGLTRLAENIIALVAGGVVRVTGDASGGIVTGVRLSIAGTTVSDVIHSTNTANWSSGIADGANRWRVKENQFGAEAISVLPNGNVGIGTTAPAARAHAVSSGVNSPVFGAGLAFVSGSVTPVFAMYAGPTNSYLGGINGLIETTSPAATGMSFTVNRANIGAIEAARLTSDGYLLVGSTSSGLHRISRANLAQGTAILAVENANSNSCAFFSVSADGSSGAAAALAVGRNTSTNRSLNAGGTINANGADYAEYMRKAANCGTILKGDICGINADGELVRSWGEAVSFMVKSTDPNLVGGDNWDGHLPRKPEQPVFAPPPYDGPAMPEAPAQPVPVSPPADAPARPEREDGEDDDEFILRMAAYLVAASSWAAAVEAWPSVQAAYDRAVATAERYAIDRAAYGAAAAAYDTIVAKAEADHTAATAQHEVDLAAWQARHDEARAGVDRIAYCGQAPVNIDGECAPGDYIVAAANGGGIKGVAVHPDHMTLRQYMRRVGKVLSIGADGRPIVDVQHG